VGLAPVVGGEGAEWASEDAVEEHAEGEREQALGDALGESGERLCEVVFESHLAFEVREHRLDDQADARLFDFAGRSFAEACFWGVTSWMSISSSVRSNCAPQRLWVPETR
jgi:hypothetical protein